MREDSLRSLSSSAVLATALGDPKHGPVGGSKHGRSKFIPFPCLYLVRSISRSLTFTIVIGQTFGRSARSCSTRLVQRRQPGAWRRSCLARGGRHNKYKNLSLICSFFIDAVHPFTKHVDGLDRTIKTTLAYPHSSKIR